ncbi:hypothetical protein PCE1_004048 [Barthelona sp. PCE]
MQIDKPQIIDDYIALQRAHGTSFNEHITVFFARTHETELGIKKLQESSRTVLEHLNTYQEKIINIKSHLSSLKRSFDNVSVQNDRHRDLLKHIEHHEQSFTEALELIDYFTRSSPFLDLNDRNYGIRIPQIEISGTSIDSLISKVEHYLKLNKFMRNRQLSRPFNRNIQIKFFSIVDNIWSSFYYLLMFTVLTVRHNTYDIISNRDRDINAFPITLVSDRIQQRLGRNFQLFFSLKPLLNNINTDIYYNPKQKSWFTEFIDARIDSFNETFDKLMNTYELDVQRQQKVSRIMSVSKFHKRNSSSLLCFFKGVIMLYEGERLLFHNLFRNISPNDLGSNVSKFINEHLSIVYSDHLKAVLNQMSKAYKTVSRDHLSMMKNIFQCLDFEQCMFQLQNVLNNLSAISSTMDHDVKMIVNTLSQHSFTCFQHLFNTMFTTQFSQHLPVNATVHQLTTDVLKFLVIIRKDYRKIIDGVLLKLFPDCISNLDKYTSNFPKKRPLTVPSNLPAPPNVAALNDNRNVSSVNNTSNVANSRISVRLSLKLDMKNIQQQFQQFQNESEAVEEAAKQEENVSVEPSYDPTLERTPFAWLIHEMLVERLLKHLETQSEEYQNVPNSLALQEVYVLNNLSYVRDNLKSLVRIVGPSFDSMLAKRIKKQKEAFIKTLIGPLMRSMTDLELSTLLFGIKQMRSPSAEISPSQSTKERYSQWVKLFKDTLKVARSNLHDFSSQLPFLLNCNRGVIVSKELRESICLSVSKSVSSSYENFVTEKLSSIVDNAPPGREGDAVFDVKFPVNLVRSQLESMFDQRK